MKRVRLPVLVFVFLVIMSPWACAATTYIDFSTSVGLLNHRISGSEYLTAVDGRASFTAPNTTLLSVVGVPVSCVGETTVEMRVQPSTDGVYGVGIIVMNASNLNEYVAAIVTSDGRVTLRDWIGNYGAVRFDDPDSADNIFQVVDDRSPGADQTTLILNGTTSLTMYSSLHNATRSLIGVIAYGPGGFDDFRAVGPSVPGYPSDINGPTILQHPTGGFAQVGDPFTMTVVADTNTAPLTCQWIKDGVDLPGEVVSSYSTPPLTVSASYTTNYLTVDHTGHYTCRATDNNDSVISRTALLVVGDAGELPAASVVALAILAGIAAVGGAIVIVRRRDRVPPPPEPPPEKESDDAGERKTEE